MKLNLLKVNSQNTFREDICELIKRRRRQIMVHSCIYYRLNQSIVDDGQFDKWAYELKDLQEKYPLESKKAELYEEFKGWDGTTGYHLNTFQFIDIAYRLIDYSKENKNEYKIL